MIGGAITQSAKTGKFSGFGFLGGGLSAGPLAGMQGGFIFSTSFVGFYYEGHLGSTAAGGGGLLTKCPGN